MLRRLAPPKRRQCAARTACGAAVLLLLLASLLLPAAAHAAVSPSESASHKKLCGLGPYVGAAFHSTMTRAPGGSPLKVYHNLALHGGKWYALVAADNNSSIDVDEGMSLNFGVIHLPVKDATAFQSNLVKPCYVPGVTVHWDFPFPGYPDNLGHWAELAWPAYGVFQDPSWALALRHPSTNGVSGSAEAAAGVAEETEDRPYVARVLLANIKAHLLDWCRETLALALAPVLPPGSRRGALPPLVEATALTDFGKTRWIIFEHVAVVQDRYPRIQDLPRQQASGLGTSSSSSSSGHDMGGSNSNNLVTGTTTAAAAAAAGLGSVGFPSPEVARRFREAAYARHWWPLGPATPLLVATAQEQQGAAIQAEDEKGQQHDNGQQQQNDITASETPSGECTATQGSCGAAGDAVTPPPLPRVVTVLLDPDHYPPVTNHADLVDALQEVAGPLGFRVRVVSLTPEAPFVSHLATMAGTGLLIARHGPLLASAVLLPPGAAVLELLPYKWDWRNMSTLYANMTASTGVIHHFAWRPRDAAWCRYAEPAHRDQYADWTGAECRGRACLEAHARAGLQVDLAAVRALVAVKLPGILRGESVAALKERWPSAED